MLITEGGDCRELERLALLSDLCGGGPVAAGPAGGTLAAAARLTHPRGRTRRLGLNPAPAVRSLARYPSRLLLATKPILILQHCALRPFPTPLSIMFTHKKLTLQHLLKCRGFLTFYVSTDEENSLFTIQFHNILSCFPLISTGATVFPLQVFLIRHTYFIINILNKKKQYNGLRLGKWNEGLCTTELSSVSNCNTISN